MRTYLIVSAVVFGVITALQLARFLLGWPVAVGGYSVPVWVSGIAAVVAGSMAIWGTRLILRGRPPATA